MLRVLLVLGLLVLVPTALLFWRMRRRARAARSSAARRIQLRGGE